MTKKQEFIGKYLDKHMKDHGLPMGMKYYSLLHENTEKAEKAWRAKHKIYKKMNKQQKDVVKSYTCGILDRYANMEDYLKSHGIDNSLLKKMNKAFDLIFEVNQSCCK